MAGHHHIILIIIAIVVIIGLIVGGVFFFMNKSAQDTSVTNPANQTAVGTPINNEPLTIAKAIYGSSGSIGSAQKDVTSIVSGLVKNNALIINPNGLPMVLNQLFGDPSKGLAKSLIITYSVGDGGTQIQTYYETSPVKINAQ